MNCAMERNEKKQAKLMMTLSKKPTFALPTMPQMAQEVERGVLIFNDNGKKMINSTMQCGPLTQKVHAEKQFWQNLKPQNHIFNLKNAQHQHRKKERKISIDLQKLD